MKDESATSPPVISVCIVCRNEADRLGACLESVRWADQIVVLDLASTDDSAELARSLGARVVAHPLVPVVEAVRNTVAEEATGDWILALDPDERAAAGLAPELRKLSLRADLDAVAIPVMNFDLGYPASHELHRFDPKPRFYRPNRVSWPTVPNALPEIDPARLFTLPKREDLVLMHERNRTVAEAIERALRYAPAQAQAMVDAGQVFSARAMFGELARKAHKQFVVGEPWRDGLPGMLRAGILVAFHFYVWAAFWQLSGARRTVEDDRFVRRIGQALELSRSAGRVIRAPVRAVRRVAR